MDNKKTWFSRFLLAISPLVRWIDKTFTMPYSHKKVTGRHYILWRDNITAGTIFITNTLGAGSNLINPSEINHSGIYFGFGLLDYINDVIAMKENEKDHASTDLVNRLHKVLKKYNVRNDVNYVLEAVGQGVIPTDLVSFLTSKDLAVGKKPTFCSSEIAMDASRLAVYDLGKDYDYSFSYRNDTKYCFELCADAYENMVKGKKLKRVEYKIFGFKVHGVFLSETFQTNDWITVFDSRDSTDREVI